MVAEDNEKVKEKKERKAVKGIDERELHDKTVCEGTERWDPEAIKMNPEQARPHEVPKMLPIGELTGTPSKCLSAERENISCVLFWARIVLELGGCGQRADSRRHDEQISKAAKNWSKARLYHTPPEGTHMNKDLCSLKRLR